MTRLPPLRNAKPAMNKLGKYQIRRTLGKGAMGVVYEGFDPVIERRVAIKTILPSQLGGDESANLLARFKREAQAAGRLNHPGIVAIYEYGEDIAQDISDDEATRLAPAAAATPAQRVAFIAMEFVDGPRTEGLLRARRALPAARGGAHHGRDPRCAGPRARAGRGAPGHQARQPDPAGRTAGSRSPISASPASAHPS